SIVNRSGDRSLLIFQQPSINTGPLSLYRAASDDFVHKNTYNTIGAVPAAISPAADRVALYQSNPAGISISTGSMGAILNLADNSGGSVFDPARHMFYNVNWVNDQIIAYDTNTWDEKYRFNIGVHVSGAVAMCAGQMAINAAG